MTPTNDTYQTEIVLELEEGSEHKLQINTDISVTSDIMYPVFRAAEVAVAGIIRSSEQFLSREQLVSKSELGNDLYGYANNIIAFSGQRGQGKTSAMLSFSEALKNYNEAKPKKLHLSKAEQFYVLDPIDPSMLQEDSALNVILSRLYQMARTAMKNLQTSENGYAATKSALEQSSREMIAQFQRCLSGVRALSGASKTPDVDDFEGLSNLVDGLRLKNQLYELVRNFLHLNGMDARSGYIVIQLDDTDLQLKNAYNVLDDICKYMTLPNVIILMATDMEQLQILVEQHYMEELKCSFDSKLVDKALLQKMAIKYLDKLIPVSQVIRLPSLNAAFESSKRVQIKVIRNEKAVGEIDDVQKKFLAMIYDKTGIAYVGSDETLHSIVPTTLRGMRHFYRFLNETLADCGERPSAFELTIHEGQERESYKERYRAWIARREQNLATFENYFLDDWCSGHLPQEYKNDLRSISEAPRDQMNRYMNLFLNRLTKRKDTDSTYCSLFRRISALTKDVGQLKDKRLAVKDGNLAAALKTILSIHLQRISLKDRRMSLDTLSGEGPFYPLFTMLEKYIGRLPFDITEETSSAHGAGEKGSPARSAQSISELFMAGLVPEEAITGNYYHEELHSKGEYSVRVGYYIDRAEQYQDYAVTVCCNPELQKLIGSYVRRPLKDLPEEQQKGFGGTLSEYYSSLMTVLAERCPYLSPKGAGESAQRDMRSTQFTLPLAMVDHDTTAPTVARNDIQNCIGKLDPLIGMIGGIKRPEKFGQDMAKAVGEMMEYVVTVCKHDTKNETVKIVKKSHEAERAANELAVSSNKSRQLIAGLCTRLKNLRKMLAALTQ